MSNFVHSIEDPSLDCSTSEEGSDIYLHQSPATSAPIDSDNESIEGKIYDCIIIGSGVSGLSCANTLLNEHNMQPRDILVIEAMDYVGGRIRQDRSFIKGIKIELGAEILHGSDTVLTQLAHKHNWSLQEIYCWAHGDGGPGKHPVNGGYGLYYFQDGQKLLRYDEQQDQEFIYTNDTIWDFSATDDSHMKSDLTLEEFMREKGVTKESMLTMVQAGFSNTFCSNSKQLSMKKCIEWCRVWDSESPTDQDYKFKDSFSCLIDHFKQNVPIKINCPIKNVSYYPTHFKSNEEDSERAMMEVARHRMSYTDGDLYSSILNSSTMSASSTDTTQTAAASEEISNLITLTANDGSQFTCRSIVVSSSLHVLKSGLLTFTPPLPEAKHVALNGCSLHKAIKVYVKFSKRCWPQGLAGMIMSGPDLLCPEVWFRDVSEEVAKYNANLKAEYEQKKVEADPSVVIEEPQYESATCYATGFATASYAEKLLALGEQGAVQQLLHQLQEIFSHLEQRHMHADLAQCESHDVTSLPHPKDVYIAGKTHQWTPEATPYVGGGFSSPDAGCREDYSRILESTCNGNIFFCGEAVSKKAGGTAHAALETGTIAAKKVSSFLQSIKKQNNLYA